MGEGPVDTFVYVGERDVGKRLGVIFCDALNGRIGYMGLRWEYTLGFVGHLYSFFCATPSDESRAMELHTFFSDIVSHAQPDQYPCIKRDRVFP